MRYAPPPSRVAATGRLAVPIDIQTIAAKLTFDAASQSVAGDATFAFQHGVDNGDAIFDLRQPVQEVWLDGAPLPASAVAMRRFGAKREQALRVIAKKLKSGDRHLVRLKYALLAPPLLASTKGGYLPELRWSGGGAIDFNFGFTDLGGGRYLEAWVPANLIYDRFSLRLDVRIRNSSTPHVAIANGDAAEVSRNHWRIRFPDTFTALSPMLQLHPRDSVEFASANSGKRSIEAWKFRSSPVNLAEQLTNIKRWIDRNERNVGVYPHGDRFVALLHKGGMEYDGACTASPDALEHEVFHSWWGRGLKPASQNDGWIDEAWTVYHDNGAAVETPFNFREPPVRLCSGTPWNRATPIASYRLGSRFFAGIAARIGVERLHAIMREFYQLHAPGLITTGQLEAHILDRTNDETIARAFRRWVFGQKA